MLQKTDSPVPSLLFFGGPYGNLQALTALRAIAEDLGLPPSSIVCTGDAVAYCAQPYETVEEIRRWGVRVVAGNVELQLANDAGDCGCNFIKESVCDRLSEQWYAFANSRITGEQRDWMRLLPTTLTLQIGGRKIGVVHGSQANVSEFLFRSSPWEKKRPNFDNLKCDIIVGGHCGIPFIESCGDKLWVNAGVIGMPANDGARRGWYLLVRENENDLKFSLHSFDYDSEQTARLMDELNLPCEYASTLRTGIWRHMDIIPMEGRAAASREGGTYQLCQQGHLRRRPILRPNPGPSTCSTSCEREDDSGAGGTVCGSSRRGMGTEAPYDSFGASLANLSQMEGQSRGSQDGRICRSRAREAFGGKGSDLECPPQRSPGFQRNAKEK